MECKKVLSRLQAYIDAELSAKLMREMEEHLGRCPACRGQAERIQKMKIILDSLAVSPLPAEFSARVMAEAMGRAALAKIKKPSFPPKWQPLQRLFDLSVPMRLAACAVILLVCLLGVPMSKELSYSLNTQNAVAEGEHLDGFEWFSPAPPESLGSAYLTLAWNTDKGQRAR